jgi:type IV pilus assembly protein PilV
MLTHEKALAMTRTLAAQSGFSMIEALVAMVVLSIGLLGLAALYTAGFNTGRSAVLRSKGVVFAADMADRIRANPAGDANYADDGTGTGTDNDCADHLYGGAVQAATVCTTVEMAEHDIFLWKQTLTNPQSGLPNATGVIDYDDTTTPPTYTVTVNWTEGEEDYSYTLAFQS